MACTIEEKNSRPCLQAILSFFLPTEKIANKICGCGCTGASIPFLFFLRFRWLMEIAGKLKLLEDCSATPNPNCGCSLNQLFCSYCYGNGSNHLIFVTRIKEVYFGSNQPFSFSVYETWCKQQRTSIIHRPQVKRKKKAVGGKSQTSQILTRSLKIRAKIPTWSDSSFFSKKYHIVK